MQVLQAGTHKLIYLELQPDMVTSIAKQAGFDTRAKDTARVLQLDLTARDRQSPLLLFDAADPANLGWFSRCQFHVEANDAAATGSEPRVRTSPALGGGFCLARCRQWRSRVRTSPAFRRATRGEAEVICCEPLPAM